MEAFGEHRKEAELARVNLEQSCHSFDREKFIAEHYERKKDRAKRRAKLELKREERRNEKNGIQTRATRRTGDQ